jgi:hypothetical protein
MKSLHGTLHMHSHGVRASELICACMRCWNASRYAAYWQPNALCACDFSVCMHVQAQVCPHVAHVRPDVSTYFDEVSTFDRTISVVLNMVNHRVNQNVSKRCAGTIFLYRVALSTFLMT